MSWSVDQRFSTLDTRDILETPLRMSDGNLYNNSPEQRARTSARCTEPCACTRSFRYVEGLLVPRYTVNRPTATHPDHGGLCTMIDDVYQIALMTRCTYAKARAIPLLPPRPTYSTTTTLAI